MWQFERLTTRRVARCSAMRSRVLRDRRRRASILFIGDLYPQPGLLLLRLFDHDSLVVITHALALVRLRRAISADFRRNLPDLLLIDPLDEDFGLHRRLYLDALRHRMDHRMRKTKRQIALVAGGLRA